MLQTIREKLTGWFAALILGAIALTLVVTFGNIDTGFTPASTAASVNGEDVPVSEFRAIYQQQRQQWEASFRAQIPAELARSMGNSVIESIVRNRALAQHVRDQGYRVNDADVIRAIRDNDVFHVGGEFSQPAYEQLLQTQGFTPQRFEYEQRQSMELQQFVEGVANTAFFTPAEFRRYIELDGETRDIDYVLLPGSLWADGVNVSDAAVQARFEQDIVLYQSPDAVTLNYVQVDFAALKEDSGISDAEVRAYYEANPHEFSGPDERQASHILIPVGADEAAAEQLAGQLGERLAAGESFASLAAEFSADTGSAATGGSLGWLGAGDSPAQAFEDALFALDTVGDSSLPVRTEFGFHLIRLDGLRAGARLDFADVAADLRNRLQEDAASDRYAELLDELDERALESLDGLAPVAEAMGLELRTVANFTRNGGGELGFNPTLVDTVFSLEVLEDGENSPVVTLEDGRAVVVRVTDYRPAQALPLAEVAAQIRDQIAQEDALTLGAVEVAAITDRLNAGEPAATVLAARGVTLTSGADLRRGDAQLPAELVAEVFRTPRPVDDPSAFRTRLLASGEYAVFRVTAARDGKPENFTLQDRDTRKEQLGLRLGGGQATAIVETLVSDATVVVAPDLLENELGSVN